MAYWWCTKHGTVEQGGRLGWFHPGRLGPFDTAEQASQAIETIHQRGAEQEAQDEAWRDGPT